MNKELIKALFKVKLDIVDALIESLPETLSEPIMKSKSELMDIIKATIEENQSDGEKSSKKKGLKKIGIE